ncbi:MAG: tetratricopeptide repeat protein [Thermoanaerobaculia bacterium]|nr:tetratricopeptide repeat protein [Thermoanaerobaculia bacterium]
MAQSSLRWWRLVFLILVSPALALGGVTSAHEGLPLGIDAEAATASLLEVTPEMREWLDAHVPSGFGKRQTLVSILENLQSKELGLTYDYSFTGTAREVFEQKRFNCLSFAHLFIGLARERGIDAYYYSVLRPARYGREGDLVLVSEHVTGAYGTGANQLTLRFAFDEEVDYTRGAPLTDSEALALHYSNLGATALIHRQNTEAVTAFRTATQLYPTDGSLWVNLGVSLRRLGDFEGAEEAYRKASLVEPGHFPAYHNLHALMVSLGRANVARELIELLDQRANRNPFTYLNLGDTSLAQGRYDEAYRFYRRALVLGARSDGRAAMGSLALARGDLEGAQRWLTKAQAAEVGRKAQEQPPSRRVVALAAELGNADP